MEFPRLQLVFPCHAHRTLHCAGSLCQHAIPCAAAQWIPGVRPNDFNGVRFDSDGGKHWETISISMEFSIAIFDYWKVKNTMIRRVMKSHNNHKPPRHDECSHPVGSSNLSIYHKSRLPFTSAFTMIIVANIVIIIHVSSMHCIIKFASI